MKKDFITATPDFGGSGSTTVTVAASANQTESTRSTSLSVAGGGMTRTVSASQAAGVVTWNYYFSVTPTSLSFVAGGETKTVTVTSYRKKVINGVETSTQENVSWSATISGTGFSKNTDGSSITAASNQGGSRNGSVSYTQTTSGKTASVSLNQAGVQYTITYKSGVDTSMYSYYAFNSSSTPSSSPMKCDALPFDGDNEYKATWDPDTGYIVNDVKKGAASTVYVKAGSKVYIRRISTGDMNWDNSSTQSFTLESNSQTVNLN